MNKKGVQPRRSQEKRQEDFNCDNINWKVDYLLTRRCTKSSKMIEFQFKRLHRRLVTNSFLQKNGLNESGNCSFCGIELETLSYLFWTCNKSHLFWIAVVAWLKECNIVQESMFYYYFVQISNLAVITVIYLAIIFFFFNNIGKKDMLSQLAHVINDDKISTFYISRRSNL